MDVVVSSSLDKSIKIWSLSEKKLKLTLKLPKPSRCFDLGQQSLVVGCDDNTAKVFDYISEEPTRIFKEHSSEISALILSQDKTLFSTGSCDGIIKIWDIRSEKCVSTIKSAHFPKVTGLLWKGSTIVSCGSDKQVKVWDVRNMNCLNYILMNDVPRCVDFDNENLAVGMESGAVKIYSGNVVSNGNAQVLVSGSSFMGTSMTPSSSFLSPSKSSLGTNSFTNNKARITCLQIDDRTKKLVTGNQESEIKFWNVETQNCIFTSRSTNSNSTSTTSDAGWVWSLRFDETVLVSGHGDNSVRIKEFYH
jgi:WD40 repeat protein